MRHCAERIPYLERFAKTHDVLHIGAGRGGYGTTLDISPSVSPSIVADLARSLPVADGSFDAVYAFNILEHIVDLVPLINEMHRVVRPGGFLSVLVPHFSSVSVHIDPTHVRGFSVRTFDYFVEGTRLHRDYGWYSTVRFRKRIELAMFEARTVNRLAGRFINRHLGAYESHLAYLIRGGAIYWELEVEK